MNGYDAWKTTEPEDPYEERPVEVEDDPLDAIPEWVLEADEAFEADPYDSPLFVEHWSDMTDEEAEARANAAMMGM